MSNALGRPGQADRPRDVPLEQHLHGSLAPAWDCSLATSNHSSDRELIRGEAAKVAAVQVVPIDVTEARNGRVICLENVVDVENPDSCQFTIGLLFRAIIHDPANLGRVLSGLPLFTTTLCIFDPIDGRIGRPLLDGPDVLR